MFIMNMVLAAYLVHIESPTAHLDSYGRNLRFFWLKNLYNGQLWFQLWYIDAELVLLLVAPIFLHCLWKFGFRIFPVIISLAFLSAGNYYHQLELFQLNLISENPTFCVETRCAPWLFGLILGFLIHKKKTDCNTNDKRNTNSKNTLKSLVVIIVSIFSAIAMLFDIIAQQTSYSGTAYLAYSSILWNLCLSWLIFWMISGEYLTVCASILSHPSLQLLAHLCYSAYLWHVPIMQITGYIQRTPTYDNAFLQIQTATAIASLSLVIAVPWALIFELPYKNLQRVIFHGQFGWRRNLHRSSTQLTGREVVV